MTIKLTQFSHGAGCGCKLSQKVLAEIISSPSIPDHFPELLVGNSEYDDAAVYDLGDGSALISTTDFFMPIVDDPFIFGKIASANAISDVYAMGGSPLMAIAILGWPIDKIPVEAAKEVLEGARATCREANIPLAGGHSIDAPEPIFGLAVSGRCAINNIKRNNGARAGDLIYLTKPLGVGILSTAQKKGILEPEHDLLAINSMVTLNTIGEKISSFSYITALTDVTGFGLLGHLKEMCEASNVGAHIKLSSVPFLNRDILEYYINQKCIPGGTGRNFQSVSGKLGDISELSKNLLCDPQTSGGLLIAVNPEHQNEFEQLLLNEKLPTEPIGEFCRLPQTLNQPLIQIVE